MAHQSDKPPRIHLRRLLAEEDQFEEGQVDPAQIGRYASILATVGERQLERMWEHVENNYPGPTNLALKSAFLQTFGKIAGDRELDRLRIVEEMPNSFD